MMEALPPFSSSSSERLASLSTAVKYCYCDESGTSSKEPVAVMAGVLVDVLRMRETKKLWDRVVAKISDLAGRPLEELHAKDFIPGNHPYRGIPSERRREIVGLILDWLAERKHHIVYASVLKDTYRRAFADGRLPDELNTEWRLMGFHVILAMEKKFGGTAKGQTQYVFDNQERERLKFADLVRNPQRWSDEYYARARKAPALQHVVDVPHFADSRHAPLVQCADLACYILRRHAELQDVGYQPKYDDERDLYATWAGKIAARSIGSSNIYPKVGRGDAENYFYDHAAPSIRAL